MHLLPCDELKKMFYRGSKKGKRRIYRNYYSPKNENVVQYNTFLENFGQCEDVFDKNKERIERKDYRNIFTERVM